MADWISVEVGLPEPYGPNVLAWSDDVGREVIARFWRDESDPDDRGHWVDENCDHHQIVTHWMPLPEAPPVVPGPVVTSRTIQEASAESTAEVDEETGELRLVNLPDRPRIVEKVTVHPDGRREVAIVTIHSDGRRIAEPAGD